eukprot:13715562-Ditylum_brightwellii.AAC.1
MVYAAMTTDWPSGLAQKIVVALHEKFALQDMVAKIKLRHALNSVSMEEQIATVLDKALTEYSTVLTCEQQQKGSALLMTDL